MVPLGKRMSHRAGGWLRDAGDGTILSLCPSFIKPTPLAPSPGSVMGGCILEALGVNPTARAGGMGWTHGPSPCTPTPGGCRGKDASANVAWYSMAWHGMALPDVSLAGFGRLSGAGGAN